MVLMHHQLHVNGRRSKAGVDTKTFADVGELLTTSVPARLSKDSGSILLNTQNAAYIYIYY